MLAPSFVQYLLSGVLQTSCRSKDVLIKSVGGGCINQCFQLVLPEKSVFLKINSGIIYPGMLEAESLGLSLLSAADAIRIPKVLGAGTFESMDFLVLEWIESGRPGPGFWADFGKRLAHLHQNSAHFYGLDHNNYIGSLVQANDLRDGWTQFFIDQRLKPQILLAKSLLTRQDMILFDRLFEMLPETFPEESASLVHGDLWNGNYICSSEGDVVLIDPAIYFGHREMDLAMMKLFGGFDEELFSAYFDEKPLFDGWEERLNLCNLYPLLVHLNLFGASYLEEIRNILSGLK